MAWGYHLMLDCYDCDLKPMTDAETVKKFAT